MFLSSLLGHIKLSNGCHGQSRWYSEWWLHLTTFVQVLKYNLEARCGHDMTKLSCTTWKIAKWYIGHSSMHDKLTNATNMQLAATLLLSPSVLHIESSLQSTLLASWQSVERWNKLAPLSVHHSNPDSLWNLALCLNFSFNACIYEYSMLK